MSEQLVNTIANLSLSEYKEMESKISDLKSQLLSKDQVIASKDAELSVAKTNANRLQDDISKASNSIFVRTDIDMHYMRNYRGVLLEKESPELMELIKKSIDKTMDETITSQKKEITELTDKVAEMKRTSKKREDSLVETHQEAFSSLEKAYDKNVNALTEKLEKLTKDYEDLKLDKAAAIVEAKRIEEINDLTAQIAELETKKDAENYIWPRGFMSTLFKKQIRRAAINLFDHYKNAKYWSKVDATSAIGKAKEYLETLKNDERNSSKSNSLRSIIDFGTTISWV